MTAAITKHQRPNRVLMLQILVVHFRSRKLKPVPAIRPTPIRLCDKVPFMPIRLMENFRAVFYAPYYATYALGFYEREGVEVELLTSDAPGDAVPKLLDGSIDLTWGGPMRVMKAHDQDRHSPLVSFCEVVSHDPFFLIGRGSAKPFRLTDLAQMKFASVSEVLTPWMCLQQDLRDSGIDPDKLPHFSDRAMTRNYHALQAGDLDVMQAFEPFVS